MKYIGRWGLMRSTTPENIAEHSLQVTWVAHALAVIENKLFGGNYDACKIGMMGAYHETGEVITGDLPTPVKYFSPEMKSAYKKVEKVKDILKGKGKIIVRPSGTEPLLRILIETKDEALLSQAVKILGCC